MPNDHIEDVRQFMAALADVMLAAEREVEELQEFIEGRRESDYPLGRVFLTNRGRDLDALRLQIESSLSPFR